MSGGTAVTSADRSERALAAEYTSLRGELGSLRNRSLAILGGALVVSGVEVVLLFLLGFVLQPALAT